MSGYFLHTKVLKLIFLFSLDIFISFNENFLTFFFLFAFFFKKKKKGSLSVGKECPAGTEQATALSSPCRNPGAAEGVRSPEILSSPQMSYTPARKAEPCGGSISQPVNQMGVN